MKSMALTVSLAAMLLVGVVGSGVAEAQTVRIATFVVTFPTSDPAPPPTMDWTRGLMTNVDAFYAEQSYGQFTLKSDVFGIYTVPLDSTATRPEIASAAQQAAIAAGVDLVPYGWSGVIGGACHCVYISPSAAIDAAGFGDGLGVWTAASAYPSVPAVRLVSHELGHHLFGLNHANGMINGSSRSQFDSLDVMGHGNGHFNAVTKTRLGWLIPLTVTDDGDYLLEPFEQTTGLRALILQGGTQKQPQTYYVEYRQPIGFDTIQPWARQAFEGAVVHLAPPQANTLLLEMTSSPNTIIDTPALTVGQTWCDDGGRLSVTPLSATPSGLLVRVMLGHCR